MLINTIKDKAAQTLDYVLADMPFLPIKKTSFGLYNSPRIALVKQEVYSDLYCCPPSNDPRSIILSSLLRSGFVGLFTKLHADFLIVKLDEAPECQVWSEISTDCNGPSKESLLELIDNPPKRSVYPHPVPQGSYAVSADNVDWSQYDIVISLNVSVPARITQKYKETVWAYCVGEPCMKTYISSREKLVPGYDLFLNQRFRRWAYNNKPHEIDFPYFLQYYGCFSELLGIAEDAVTNKRGVILERHSVLKMSDADLKRFETIGPVCFQDGDTEQMLRTLLSSKYYFRLLGPNRWGNAMVESAAAGCLFLGNRWEFYNRALFSPFTHIRSIDEFFRKIEILENNATKYNDELHYLKMAVDEYCFNKPVQQLLSKAEIIKKKKTA